MNPTIPCAFALVLAFSSCATPEISMKTQTRNPFLLEDLEDAGKTREIAKSDLDALRTIAGWVRTFVAMPHKDIGRPGLVCPFVQTALERESLWLAPERIADLSSSDLLQLVDGYKQWFLQTPPTTGDGVNYNSLVIVFNDLPADRAKGVLDPLLQQLAAPSYVDDGLVMGGFSAGNPGTAIYNADFQPFHSQVPFLLIRHAVISD